MKNNKRDCLGAFAGAALVFVAAPASAGLVHIQVQQRAAEFGEAALRGVKAVFVVDVKEIRSPVKPKIDDEFAKQLGFESLAKRASHWHADPPR